MFCDADDTYELSMCEILLNKIHKSSYDLVMCDTNIIEIEKNTRTIGAIEYNNLNFCGETQLDERTKADIRTVLWNKIFRMDIIRKYDISFPNGFEMDDDAFIMQYIAIAQTAFGLNKKLYNYKLLASGIMSNYYRSNNSKKIFDAIFAYEYAIRRLNCNNLLTPKNKIWLIKKINNKLKWGLQLLQEKQTSQYLDLIKEKLLPFFTPDNYKYYPLLCLCQQKKYTAAYCVYKNYTYKTFCGFSKRKTPQENIIKFFNIPLLK